MGQEARVATVSRSKPRPKETGLYGQLLVRAEHEGGFSAVIVGRFPETPRKYLSI